MTLKERVIVETYTGICMTSGDERWEVYKYMAEIMGRPVYTHELAEDEIQRELKEKSKPDFVSLCKGENDVKSTSYVDEKNIVAALKIINEICWDNVGQERDKCVCPFYSPKEDKCLVCEKPCNWKINDSGTVWRALFS